MVKISCISIGKKLMGIHFAISRIPEVLQPFMMGIAFIPFRKMVDKKGKYFDLPAPAAPKVAAVVAQLEETSLDVKQ